MQYCRIPQIHIYQYRMLSSNAAIKKSFCIISYEGMMATITLRFKNVKRSHFSNGSLSQATNSRTSGKEIGDASS